MLVFEDNTFRPAKLLTLTLARRCLLEVPVSVRGVELLTLSKLGLYVRDDEAQLPIVVR